MIARLLVCVLVLGIGAAARASVWFSSAPSSVQSGTGYYVEASGSGGSFSLNLYKNGGYFAGGSGSGWGSVGSSTVDYSTGTVSYTAEFYDWYTMDYDYAYASVTITPANTAPTITWTLAPGSAAVNQTVTIQARGNDSEGQLTNVNMWLNDSPFAFAGASGGEGYATQTFTPTSPGNYTLKAQATDAQGASSGFIYFTLSVYNNAPTITWINYPSSAYVNQWFHIQARGDDANGNLSTVFVWRDDQPFAFNGGGNGYQGYSDNNAAQGTAAGTITFKARASDANGAESGFIYHYVSIIKADQTITFSQPAAQTYGGQLTLNASASSGLTVSYVIISGPATVSYNTVTFTGVGNVLVRALQAGNGAYNAAASVDRTITVNKADQTITFNQPSAQTYGTSLTLSATASSGLPVSFTIVSGSATLSGNVLTFTGVGSVVVRAIQGGSEYYNAATSVDRTITPNKATQTITFSQPAAQTYGIPLTPNATASSGLAISYSIVSGSATVSGSTVTFTGVGSVTVRAAQSGNANFNAATSVDRSFTVNKATPTGIFANRIFVTPQTPTTYTVLAGDLNAVFAGPFLAVAQPTGTVTYTLVGPGTAVTAGTTLAAATYTVRASYPGNANYNAATKDVTWLVTPDGDSDQIPNYIETQLGTNPSSNNNEDDNANQIQLQVHRPAK